MLCASPCLCCRETRVLAHRSSFQLGPRGAVVLCSPDVNVRHWLPPPPPPPVGNPPQLFHSRRLMACTFYLQVWETCKPREESGNVAPFFDLVNAQHDIAKCALRGTPAFRAFCRWCVGVGSGGAWEDSPDLEPCVFTPVHLLCALCFLAPRTLQ